MNKYFRIVSITLIITTILISYFILSQNKITDFFNEIPIRYLIIKSNSMYPTFEVGDIVIIIIKDQYKVGDIITYDYNHQYLITHRIVNMCEKGFVTKGDYNNCEDEDIVKFENVKGKVVYIISKKIQVFLFIIITTFILINYIKNRKEKIK